MCSKIPNAVQVAVYRLSPLLILTPEHRPLNDASLFGPSNENYILLLGCSDHSVFYRKILVSDKALMRQNVCMAEFSWSSETNFWSKKATQNVTKLIGQNAVHLCGHSETRNRILLHLLVCILSHLLELGAP